MNLGTFAVSDGQASIGDAQVRLPRATADALTGSEVTLGFRPETLSAVSEGTPGAFAVEALVIEELGSDAFLYASLVGPGSDRLNSPHIVARVPPRAVPQKGEKVWLRITEGELHAFDASTGEVLPT